MELLPGGDLYSQVVQLGNQYIDVQAPWALRKTDPERMATVLWVLLEALRHVGVASNPNPNPNPNPYPNPYPYPNPNPRGSWSSTGARPSRGAGTRRIL